MENINTVKKYLKAIESLGQTDDLDHFREIIHPEYYISKRRLETRESQQKSSDQILIKTALEDTDEEWVGIDKFIETLQIEDYLSEAKIEIYKISATENTVWVDMDISGMHNNTVFGIPPTNQFIKYRAIFIYQFENRKIITSDGLYDHLSFLGFIGKAVFNEPDSETTKLYLKYLCEKGLISNQLYG